MLEHPEIELETGLGPSGEEPEGGLRKRPELVLGDLFECDAWHCRDWVAQGAVCGFEIKQHKLRTGGIRGP